MVSNMDFFTLVTRLVSYLILCSRYVLSYLRPLLAPFSSVSPAPLETYEQWRRNEAEFDELFSAREWASQDEDPAYLYQNLRGFKTELETCRKAGNLRGLCTHLRYQSWSRNICNILSSSLYRKSRIRTKKLIHDYVNEVRRSVSIVVEDSSTKYAVVVSKQEKKDLLRDMQASLGKTSLLLQGGAFVSMCHLGVARALYKQGLLPQIITGTGTGALIAALIGITPEEKLADVLDGPRIDLGSFTRARQARRDNDTQSVALPRWWKAFVRRARRLAYTGHFFEIGTLANCAKDNLGELTFEEAFSKTGRVLNITIAMPEVAGTPTLLNYITAPHVLVWSAVAASVATSKRLYAPAHLYCKDDTGQVRQYFAVDATEVYSQRTLVHPESALERIGELFNVNHFIVSQTRPYIIPFYLIHEKTDSWPVLGTLIKLILSEAVHWLYIIKWFGVLPHLIQRLLIDESLPNSESWSKVDVIPDLSLRDYFAIFDLPTTAKIKNFAQKGERGVWLKMCQLRIRCSIEAQVEWARRNQLRSQNG